MLAERRDFTVATYSSSRGTGARLIVCVLTGIGCGTGCLASVLLHPELVTTANAISRTSGITASCFTVVMGVFLKRFKTTDDRRASWDSALWDTIKAL